MREFIFNPKETLDARDLDKGVVRGHAIHFHQWRFDFKRSDDFIDVLRQSIRRQNLSDSLLANLV